MYNFSTQTHTLKNGAQVIKHSKDVVLALFRNEYVTWKCKVNDETGLMDCFWGHYFGTDLANATDSFYERSRLL